MDLMKCSTPSEEIMAVNEPEKITGPEKREAEREYRTRERGGEFKLRLAEGKTVRCVRCRRD